MPRTPLPAELVPVVENSYWREADAERVLSVWTQSGLTLSAFARQCGLSVSRLRRWKKQLEDRGGPLFHPVEIVTEANREHDDRDSGVALVVREGRRIAVSRGFDRDVLRELIEAIEGDRC